MYLGLHGLTVIELPSKQVEFSRDVYIGLKPQNVIEVVGVGRFMVSDVSSQWSRDDAIQNLPPLVAPCHAITIKVKPGEFAKVETDYQFNVGIELRSEPEAVTPLPQLTVRQADFILTALEQAEALNKAAKAISSGRLSASTHEQVIAATVFIECEYKCGPKSFPISGTGFVINPRGYIVTNSHVVSPTLPLSENVPGLIASRSSVRVTFSSGLGNQKTLPAEVIRYSEAPDLALLKVDEAGLDFLCLDQEEVKELQPVIALGYPGGKMLAFSGGTPGLSFRSGQITAVRNFPSRRTITVEHSAPIEEGNSGGPLVTPRGTVIGVNTFLDGPQQQSRFAISKDTTWGFLFQEAAEGKGTYYGPTTEERYVIAIAQINLVWDSLDHSLFDFQTQRLYSLNGPATRETMSVEQAKALSIEIGRTLDNLLQALSHTDPPPQHRMSHRKIREAMDTVSETVDKMVRLIARDAEDKIAGTAKSFYDDQSDIDRQMSVLSLGNDIQEARTKMFLAMNRVIGQYYASIEQKGRPKSPVWLPLGVDKYQADEERHIINEFGDIFQRHRGDRVVILRFQIENWVRPIVYQHALVSGSKAMWREINRLVKEHGWGELPEDYEG